jgi:hypothetical protein
MSFDMSTRQNIIKKYMCCFFVFLFSVFLCSTLSACNTISTPPNSTSNSQAKPTPKMNEQVSEFLHEHNLTLADKPGWVPSKILDYSDRTDEEFNNKLKNNITGYIVSIHDDKIGINEVTWISNVNEDGGFKIVDSSPEVIQYQLAQDVEVWVLTQMVHIQIPLQDLKSYIEKYEYTLWNVGVKEGKVITLIEKYVP